MADDHHQSLVETLDALRRTLEKQSVRLERLTASAGRSECRELLRNIADPTRLEHWGRKVYSQTDEDGIIAEIFRRLSIESDSGVVVEIGAGSGLENNTHLLLRQGFRAGWVDGGSEKIEKISRVFNQYIECGQLVAESLFCTAENIDTVIAKMAASEPVSLLSIDVDGNDYWLWKSVTSTEPAVVLIEYNGKFPPPMSVVQPYTPDHAWTGTDYFGASLSAMCKLGKTKGYELVGCNITGTNAFFVRRDLVNDRFPYPLTAEHLYQPCRYHLINDCFASEGFKAKVGRFESV